MSIVLTGGSGFIGSCILSALNEKGEKNIIVVDNVSKSEKWKNLNGKQFITYINKANFLNQMESYNIDAIIHMGACSATTETDFDYLWNNNVEYSKALFTYCNKHNIPFIYASSAATYGDGEFGFSDQDDISKLHPLNRYGYSKQSFDIWLKSQTISCQCVGLKFFNVYGPNEYHKQGMFSMVFQGYHQIIETGEMKLFKSNRTAYADGEQRRDFVYVKDVCNLVLWLLDNPHISGLFNVGTGNARTFNDLAYAIFAALNQQPNIIYIDMPSSLIKQYQYFTEADMSKLRTAGYKKPFLSLEDGVEEYVCQYLMKDSYY